MELTVRKQTMLPYCTLFVHESRLDYKTSELLVKLGYQQRYSDGDCTSGCVPVKPTAKARLIMPPHRRGGGIKRSSASVVHPSDVAYIGSNQKTKRRHFAQGYPRSHATPTPTSRSKVQKSRSAGAGAYCGGHLAAQLVKHADTRLFPSPLLPTYHFTIHPLLPTYHFTIHVQCRCNMIIAVATHNTLHYTSSNNITKMLLISTAAGRSLFLIAVC